MGASVLHIKSEIECRVFLFDEEKGIATPDKYFNLEVRKGEQDLLFVSTNDDTKRCQMFYNVVENDCDYRIVIKLSQFEEFSHYTLDLIERAKNGDSDAQCQLGLLYAKGDDVKQSYEEAFRWFLLSANQGNSRANHFLGICYLEGKGVEQDYSEAVEWFRKAAEQGIAGSQVVMGYCYENGKGVEKDCDEAVNWYRKAADQGHKGGQYALGLCYEGGRGVEQDWSEAVNWYRKAAEQGHDAAQFKLGTCHAEGKGVEQDWNEAVKWYRKAAEHGNAIAQYDLGKCYECGNGVTQDWNEALKWYKKAVEDCRPEAEYSLGKCYYHGHGVEQDYSKAIALFRKAYKSLSDAHAAFYIGRCYLYGNGVERDDKEAVKWFEAANEFGTHYYSMYILGQCYKNSRGVKQNYEKALSCFISILRKENKDYNPHIHLFQYGGGLTFDLMSKDIIHGPDAQGFTWINEDALNFFKDSATKGDVVACNTLGYYYDVKEENPREAIIWYRLAAVKGNYEAQINLGWCYKEGVGVEQDLGKAEEWYAKATDNCQELARRVLGFEYNTFRISGKDKSKKVPYYLFFDTETTGVPRNYNAPASDISNWPRLVQLGWILTDTKGNTISERCEIVKPDGFSIPIDAVRVHGITTEKALREGEPLREVINTFLADAKLAKCIVGHNISFDQHIVGAELCRLGITDTISRAKSICTMQAGTNFCKIPDIYGYKWPKLQELYKKLFGITFDKAHNAMADIEATKKCFFELLKLGVIKKTQI